MQNYFGTIASEKSFPEVLAEVQNYISTKYATLVSGDSEKNKQQLKNYIRKFLEDEKLSVAGLDQESLIEKLFREMAEYSFLTNYLFSKDVEEININRWDDVKISYADGSVKPSEERFRGPEHAFDVIRRLLRSSGMVLDASQPTVRGHMYGNIRITAYCPPVVDKEAGVSASIRLVNPRSLKREEFIKYGTANEDILDFLLLCCKRGVSQVCAGATNSGKTTLMSWELEEALKQEPDLRLITIENETREFNLVQRDDKGNVLNNVIHLVTRKSNDQKQNINQEDLLELALTSNPDVVCVAEMKSAEAFAAQEAARTGHVVLTTTHSNSCMGTYPRMVTLCRMKYDIDFETLYELVTEAFPISVYIQKIKGSSKRRIQEIAEMEILPDRKRKLRTLWKYKASTDSFEKVNGISDYLADILRNGFATEDEIRRFQ